jgi:hypothetical protein
MLRRTALLLAVLALHADPGALTAQAQPVSQAAAPAVRSGVAARVDVGPTIDGRLDEAVWATAEPLGGFVQYEPVEGASPSEETQARFLFDGDAVYIGAWMYDREPDRIITGERRRDATLTDSDAVLVVLDTYLDQQTGFVFGTNPGAIEYDGQVRGEGGANTSWDGSWTVATSQDDEGWYAEMRIPFSTLRLGPGAEQTWGLNLMRYIGRKNEQVVWSPVPRQYGFFRLTEAGHLSGLQPPPRRVMTVTPYVLTAASRVPRIDPDTDYPFETGADAKIGITQGLALDLTYNTDFAQVEADDQQVDLTRFNLFFPEKRPFFLENADLFTVGLDFLPGRTSGRTALFHSRRIGVASGGQVPIELGGRLSGRAAGIDVGALHMRTDGLTGIQEPMGWTVARVAKELPNRSRVGAIFTDRSSTTSSDFGRTYGADARLGFGERWTFNTVAGMTEQPGVSDSRELLSAVGEYLTPTWYLRAYHDRVGDNFDPQLGFIPNPSGFTESSGRIERIWRPQGSWLREARAHVRRTWAHDLTGFKELEFRHLHLNFSLQDGSQFSPAFQWMEEGLRVPFVISGAGITVPAGSYKGWNSYGNFRTNPAAPISFNGRWDMGMYLSGNRWGGTLGMGFRRGAALTGSVSVSHNRIRLPEGDYNTTLTRVGAQYAFSPSVFLQSVVQYSDQSGTWTGNVRFGWLGTAGTGLYVVYNERQEMDVTGVSGLFPRDASEPAERTLAIKFTQQIDLAELADF